MRHLKVIATVVVIAACSSVLASQTPSGHAMFEQALAKERVEGNLPEAIRLYERVVAEFAADRALASRALLQVGLCYEKLGQTGARAAYERLLREYPDQMPFAGEAKSRLAALPGGATAPAARGGMTPRELRNVSDVLWSVSPDGTQALVDDSDGDNLAIIDLSTGRSRLLTNFDGTSSSWASFGSWSRDGRYIAYAQVTRVREKVLSVELRVTTLDGKARTISRKDGDLTQDADNAVWVPKDWLPDGSAIMTVVPRPGGMSAIGLVAIADGRFTPLRTLGWDFSREDGPTLSPDGRFVAFVERTSGQGDIHVLSIDGRHAFRITDHPADDRLPIWSPDGRQLAFISNRLGADALWSVAMEGGDVKGEAIKLKDGMTGVRPVDWSPRGLIYQQKQETSDVFTITMAPGSTRATGSPRPLPYTRSGWNLAPAWSPDGESLAFVSGSRVDPRNRYLVVRSSAGAVREFALPRSLYSFGPGDLRWFGNGRGLGFSGVDDKGRPVVFRLSLPTGEWATIASPVTNLFNSVEWNEDGTAFYFVRSRTAEQNGVFRRSVEGGGEELLYALAPSARPPAGLQISPNRRWLAFQHTVEGTGGPSETQVIVVNTASGERRTVTSLTSTGSVGERLRLSGWSPDGRVLVQRYLSGSSLPANWELVPLDGGASEPLSLAIPAGTGAAPTNQPLAKWSPNGSAIAFVQIASSERVFLLENPLADLPAAKSGATRR